MGAKRDLRTMFLRLILVIVYCILGAAVFYAIEHEGGYEEELKRKKALDVYNNTMHVIMQNLGMNKTEFMLLVAKLNDATSDIPLDWTFSRGLDLSWQAMTTIGYGNKPPVTAGGQLFLIPFALFGIPLTAFMLKTVGENICHLICYIINKIEKNILDREVTRLHMKSLIVTCVLTISLIFLMAGVSMHYDEWTFVEGMYVWFVTFTTIGFGDYIPGAEADAKSGIGAVLYRMIFMVIGLSMCSTILNAIGSMVESRKKTKHLKPCRTCFCFQCCWPIEQDRVGSEIEKKEDSRNDDKGNIEMQHYV